MVQAPKGYTPSIHNINPLNDGKERYDKRDHVFTPGMPSIDCAKDIRDFEKNVAQHPGFFEVEVKNDRNGHPISSSVFFKTDAGQRLEVLKTKAKKDGVTYTQFLYDESGKKLNELSRTWENFRVFDGNPETIESKELQAEVLRSTIDNLDKEIQEVKTQKEAREKAYPAAEAFYQKHGNLILDSGHEKDALKEYQDLISQARKQRQEANMPATGFLRKNKLNRQARKAENQAQACLSNHPKLAQAIEDLKKLQQDHGTELGIRTANKMPYDAMTNFLDYYARGDFSAPKSVDRLKTMQDEIGQKETRKAKLQVELGGVYQTKI